MEDTFLEIRTFPLHFKVFFIGIFVFYTLLGSLKFQAEVLTSLSMKLQKRRIKQFRVEVWMFSLMGMFSRLKVGHFFL